jgi:SSS family transporter
MLTTIDWTIIAVYLAAMIAVGIACRGKQDDSADYFIAKGGLSGVFGSIIIGLSIAATFFSGISFLAYPANVYQHGLLVTLGLPTFLVVWLVLRFVFLPRYLAGGWQHPYEILERRYGLGVRRVAALLFVLMRIGWMATLIYAPTSALLAAAGLGPEWYWPIIFIVGLSSTIYTAFGGIRGVIITDAIQFLLIIAGIAITLIYILVKLPVPLGDAVALMHHNGRLNWWEPSLSLTKPLTLWAVLIGFTVASLGSYLGDQMALQRYLTSSSVAESSRSFLVKVIGVVIVLLMLFAVGVSLGAWYLLKNDPQLPSATDQIFPYFIAKELPAGVSGLLLAALLAATMSSITSGINALAGSILIDFRRGGDVGQPDALAARKQLWIARGVSLAIGVVATLSAGLVVHLGQLFDITQKLLGVFLGPLAVCLLLAVLNVRVSGRALIASLLAGCAAGWLAALTPNIAAFWPSVLSVDSLWVSPIACLASALVALIGVLVAPATSATEVEVQAV